MFEKKTVCQHPRIDMNGVISVRLDKNVWFFFRSSVVRCRFESYRTFYIKTFGTNCYNSRIFFLDECLFFKRFLLSFRLASLLLLMACVMRWWQIESYGREKDEPS